MSLMGMRRALRKYGTPIWITLALALVVGSFVGLGSYLGGDTGLPQTDNEPPIATVGDMKITRTALDRTIGRMSASPSPQELIQTRLFLLEQFKQQQAVVEAAKQAGITVTDADIQKARDDAWARQRSNYVAALGLRENATDAELNRALAAQNLSVNFLKQQFPEDDLRASVYAEKLQEKFREEAQAKATEEAVRNSYADIQVRHILIRSGEGALPEEQAREKARKLLEEVKANPAKMPQLANQHSEDPGNTGPKGEKQGGFYDWSPANRYVPAFTEAALSVQPNQVYPELVQTPYGFHIIKLEGKRAGASLPKDFDKEKQKYIAQYVDTLVQQRAQEAIAAALPNVKVTINDPALRAAQLQQEAERSVDPKEREAKLNSALAELEKAQGAEDPLIAFQRASLYESLGKNKEAIAAYNQALQYRNTVETRLALAQLHLKAKDREAAVKELQQAEELVRGEVNSQAQLAALYREAGRNDLAETADKKFREMLKRQAEMNPTPQGGNISLPPAAAEGDSPGSGG